MEDLLNGGTLQTQMGEEIIYSDLNGSAEAVWSLMVASGYLRIENVDINPDDTSLKWKTYTLSITNGKTRRMFATIIRRWFRDAGNKPSNK